jgi:hypothetical protein
MPARRSSLPVADLNFKSKNLCIKLLLWPLNIELISIKWDNGILK